MSDSTCLAWPHRLVMSLILLLIANGIVPRTLDAWQMPPLPVLVPGQEPPSEHFGAMANTGDTASLTFDPNWKSNSFFLSRWILSGTRWVDAAAPRWVLTYTMSDDVSAPIEIVIDYPHSLFIRDRLVFPNDPDAPRRDPVNWIFGDARDHIPSLTLETLKVVRQILAEYDRLGFRPPDSRLVISFRSQGNGDPSYRWTSRQINIFPTGVSDLEVYRGILYHEIFHAAQQASGLSIFAEIDKSHLWFDEATANYITHFVFGASLPDAHRQAPPTFFWNPLISGSYYVEWRGEAHSFQEYLGAHFLHYYLGRLGLTGDGGRGFSEFFHTMLSSSGWALNDQELPSLMDGFAQQTSGISLSEIYTDFVVQEILGDGSLLRLAADKPEQGLVWRYVTLNESRPRTVVRYIVGNQLTATVEALSLEAAADKMRRVRISMTKEGLDHARVFCKVGPSIRGDGTIFELESGVEAFVDLSEENYIFILKINASSSADTPFDPTPFEIEFERVGADDPLIKAFEAAVGKLEGLQLELEATQVNQSQDPGKLDVQITTAVTSSSQQSYAEVLREIRGILRELKCAPRITAENDWFSSLEGEEGVYRTEEFGSFPISMTRTVTIGLEGPAVLVKRLQRTITLPEATLDVEVKEIAPPSTLEGRWTGLFTIQAMPGLEGIDNEAPIDPEEDPFGAACQAMFRQLKALEGKPLDTVVRFEPQRKSGPGIESGIAWLQVTLPGQDEQQDPQPLQYTYDQGQLSIRYAVENQRVVMTGEAKWRSKDEGPGAAIKSNWNAYGKDEQESERLIMRGTLALTNPRLK